jgi:predicted nucleotidyltransferase
MRNLKDIELKKMDRMAVQEAGNILRERFPVEKIILFGSKTRGDDDPESDIDLLVLTSHPLAWREKKAITYALFDVEMKYDVVISVLVTSTKEWGEGPFSVLPIYDEILQHGAVA